MVRNCAPTCGPKKWKLTTLETIEASDTITKKINTSIEKGKICDPLWTLREQEHDFEIPRNYFLDKKIYFLKGPFDLFCSKAGPGSTLPPYTA